MGHPAFLGATPSEKVDRLGPFVYQVVLAWRQFERLAAENPMDRPTLDLQFQRVVSAMNLVKTLYLRSGLPLIDPPDSAPNQGDQKTATTAFAVTLRQDLRAQLAFRKIELSVGNPILRLLARLAGRDLVDEFSTSGTLFMSYDKTDGARPRIRGLGKSQRVRNKHPGPWRLRRLTCGRSLGTGAGGHRARF